MKEVIFFDLDGPILEVSEKYYQVYFDLITQMKGEPITKQIYWELKRHKVPDAVINELSHVDLQQAENFKSQRKNLIETEHYLKFDTIQPGMIDILAQLFQKYNLYILTYRNNHLAVQNQLVGLDLTRYFTRIFTAQEEEGIRWKNKADLISKHINRSTQQFWMIGDTETDMLAGQAAMAKTIAVTYGIRCRDWLSLTNPAYIITQPKELLTIL